MLSIHVCSKILPQLDTLALADMFDSKVCTWFMDELSSESEYASVDDAESNEAEEVSVPESSVRLCFLFLL